MEMVYLYITHERHGTNNYYFYELS